MQSYLHDLPSTYNLVMLDLVRRGRLLYKHNEGRLLVKIYFKRAGEPLELKSPPDSRVEPEPPLEHGSDVQEVELRMDHDMVVVGARIIKSAGGIRGGAVPAAGHGSPWVAADAQGEFRCQDGV
ncbi:unnamed protein product [Triticum turgidum subsp. durum]|uniref:Uncharacterized protein n=1 Tax=Triticum turgidum subsp. durum TaxID=4567 RepID=A0A9R0WBW0_TRITD|nr:unnamed protein product [Triticum turgidum subsp. durum]